ncbi:MAG: C40 family peptidase [Steroidobacteraceae bacterium]
MLKSSTMYLRIACSALLASVLTGALNGCASAPPQGEAPARQAIAGRGEEVALRALAMIGTPYQYGGNGPQNFDCSGLVQYIYRGVGIEVPRTAAEQFDATQTVDLAKLRPGDLLFFRIHGRISHVAIYAGERRFVHAPQTGRTVELRPLDDPYYAPRLVRGGRFGG